MVRVIWLVTCSARVFIAGSTLGPSADAIDASDDVLSGAENQPNVSAYQISTSFEELGNSPNPSGVAHRCQLHPNAPGLSVSGRRHGLEQPKGAELAAVKLHG